MLSCCPWGNYFFCSDVEGVWIGCFRYTFQKNSWNRVDHGVSLQIKMSSFLKKLRMPKCIRDIERRTVVRVATNTGVVVGLCALNGAPITAGIVVGAMVLAGYGELWRKIIRPRVELKLQRWLTKREETAVEAVSMGTGMGWIVGWALPWQMIPFAITGGVYIASISFVALTCAYTVDNFIHKIQFDWEECRLYRENERLRRELAAGWTKEKQQRYTDSNDILRVREQMYMAMRMGENTYMKFVYVGDVDPDAPPECDRIPND